MLVRLSLTATRIDGALLQSIRNGKWIGAAVKKRTLYWTAPLGTGRLTARLSRWPHSCIPPESIQVPLFIETRHLQRWIHKLTHDPTALHTFAVTVSVAATVAVADATEIDTGMIETAVRTPMSASDQTTALFG
jgi:hypothetical protein